ncbi:MAG: sulfatase-like hydrolase/transferase [bacterium]|nr:sulfatase-like hydrolase/transferase [bacterium]
MKQIIFYSIGTLLILAGCMSTADDKWNIISDSEGIQNKKNVLETLNNKSQDKRPNIILIVADDLGKFEVSGYGATHIETPNIDAIGENGIRFKDAYVTAPICAPSRAGMLTGKYQQRYGFETQPMEFYPNKMQYALGKRSKRLGDWTIATPPSYPARAELEHQGIPEDQTNLAEVLKASGYSTGIIGKWHLGHGEKHIPNNRGFDYQYGFYGAFSLYTPEQKTPGYVNHIQDDMSAKHQWEMKRKKNAAIRENNVVVEEEDYLTFALRDKAKSFISERKDSSFFLYLSFNAPHVPFQAPQNYYDQFSHVKDKNQRVYLAMIKALDDAIGEVLSEVRAQGIEENTIIYFISDNGGATYTGATDNGPLKGGKFTQFEGGVNVPFMMQWKGHLREHTVYNYPVSALDIFATTVAACNVVIPENQKYDGVNLLPFVSGEIASEPHEKIYWRTDHIRAIRYQKWKLIMSTRDDWLHLYNLENDLSEEIDLSDFNPDEKSKLLRFFEEWNADLPQEYLWPRIMDRKFIIGDKTYFFPT